MNADEVPTLGLYYEIIEEIMFGPSCDVWAMSLALRTATMVVAIVLLIIYVYVVAIIIKNFKKLNNPFYICVLSLSVSDFILLLTSMQESRVQSCILGSIPARQVAWQTIGTLSLDGILTNGFVLALTRFATIFFFAKESLHWSLAKYGAAVSWLWTVIAAALNHFGLVSKIWFEADGYHDRFLFPFQYVNFFVMFVCVGGVFVLYLVSFVKLVKLRAQTNPGIQLGTKLTQELRILVQCVIIFAGELLYLYATFWFGLNYLHLGSSEMNARLNYLVRPLQGGINPILYLIFSSEIRRMAFPCFANTTCCWNKINPHTRIPTIDSPQRWSIARNSSIPMAVLHQ